MLKNFTFGWNELLSTLSCAPPPKKSLLLDVPLFPNWSLSKLKDSPFNRLTSQLGEFWRTDCHGWRQKSIPTSPSFCYFEAGILESQGSAWETSDPHAQLVPSASSQWPAGHLHSWCHGLALSTHSGSRLLGTSRCVCAWEVVFCLHGPLNALLYILLIGSSE